MIGERSRAVCPVRRSRHDERGAVLVMVAISLTVIMVAAALAVDIGRTAAEAAHVRNVVDLAAIDAARDLGWDPKRGPEQRPEVVARAAAAARATAMANGLSAEEANALVVRVGGLATTDEPGVFEFDESITPFTAVLVSADAEVDFAFARGTATPNRYAVARINADGGTGLAAISAQTYAVDVNTDRVALVGAILQKLGTTVDLGVLRDIEVADAEVSLLGVIRRLNVPVETMPVDQVLNLTYDLSDFLGAVVDEISGTSVGSALKGLNLFGQTVRPGDFIKLPNTLPSPQVPAPPTSLPAGAPSVPMPPLTDFEGLALDAYDLIEAALMSRVIGQTLDLGLNLSLNNLLPGMPSNPLVPHGILTASVTAKISEGAQLAIGGVGTTARTSQIELGINVSSSLGLTIPITLELASGSATIESIDCTVPMAGSIPSSVGTSIRSALLTPYVGHVNPGPPKEPVKTTLLSLSLSSLINTIGATTNGVSQLLGSLGLTLVGGVVTLVGGLLDLLTGNANKSAYESALAKIWVDFGRIEALPTSGTHTFTPSYHPPEANPRYDETPHRLVAGTNAKPTVFGGTLKIDGIGLDVLGLPPGAVVGPLVQSVIGLVTPLLEWLVDPLIDLVLRLTGIGVAGIDTRVPWAQCSAITPTLVSVKPPQLTA